jgi:AraC-like DNA-binding protein
MSKEPSLRPDYEATLRTFRGNVSAVKPFSSEIWFCHFVRGKVKIRFNHQIVELGGECYFPAFDGMSLEILESSPDMEMEALVFSLQYFNAVYPMLSMEMEAEWDYHNFLSSLDMDPSYREMLALSHRQLVLLLLRSEAKGLGKMMVWASCQYVLTWFNGVSHATARSGAPAAELSNQGLKITNRFYEILSEKESLKHRDIGYYAARLGISARYLHKVCRSIVNETPKELINEAVVGEIKHLLLGSELTVQQIAIRLDFPDQSSMYQYFKRNVGMTPTEFRAKYK